MKDIPAMGNKNYSISTSLTGDSGEALLAALGEPQRKLVTGLVDQQRQDMAEIVQTRRAIATELRRFMKEVHANVTRNHRCKTIDGLLLNVEQFLKRAQPYPGARASLAKATPSTAA